MTRIRAIDKFDHNKLTKKILRRKTQIPEPHKFDPYVMNLEKFNRLGEEIDNELWLQYIYDPEYNNVQRDLVDNFMITTNWYGINLLVEEKNSPDIQCNRPCIFNTDIVFVLTNHVIDGFYYSSEEMAFKNHQKLVFMADQQLIKMPR